MNLLDILTALSEPDHVEGEDALDMEVVFDTSDRHDLGLLSVYASEDGKIHIDIGEDDE